MIHVKKKKNFKKVSDEKHYALICVYVYMKSESVSFPVMSESLRPHGL